MVDKKLANVLCNLVSLAPGVSRTQLVKLAYLSDRKHYEDYNKSLTGTDYVLYYYGPYSHAFKSTLNSLKQKNIIEEKYDGVSYHISINKKAVAKIPELDLEERNSLDETLNLVKEKNLLRSASAIKKYVYNLSEVKEAEPFERIELSDI